jgi:hypothetical protein
VKVYEEENNEIWRDQLSKRKGKSRPDGRMREGGSFEAGVAAQSRELIRQP